MQKAKIPPGVEPNMTDAHTAAAQMLQDIADKRCLRGKFAPRPGVCRVCGGKVIADISFQHDGRIGGPPPPAHVSGWHCDECQIVYRVCPPSVDASGKVAP
jgi:hypothetical protein